MNQKNDKAFSLKGCIFVIGVHLKKKNSKIQRVRNKLRGSVT